MIRLNTDIVCKNHPKYKAKRPPRDKDCWACRVLYFLVQDGKFVFVDGSAMELR